MANVGDDTLSIFFGDGTRTLPSPITRSTGRDPVAVAIADVNLYGVGDIVVSCYADSILQLFLHDGSPVTDIPLGNEIFFTFVITNRNTAPLSISFNHVYPNGSGGSAGFASTATISDGGPACPTPAFTLTGIKLSSGTLNALQLCAYSVKLQGQLVGPSTQQVAVDAVGQMTTQSNAVSVEVIGSIPVTKTYENTAGTPITSAKIQEVIHLLIKGENI